MLLLKTALLLLGVNFELGVEYEDAIVDIDIKNPHGRYSMLLIQRLKKAIPNKRLVHKRLTLCLDAMEHRQKFERLRLIGWVVQQNESTKRCSVLLRIYER